MTVEATIVAPSNCEIRMYSAQGPFMMEMVRSALPSGTRVADFAYLVALSVCYSIDIFECHMNGGLRASGRSLVANQIALPRT